MLHNAPFRAGFSLVELVIVVVIIGLIGAIAIPRLSSAGDRSRAGALSGDLALLTQAIEHYAAEHADLTPADDPASGPGTDGSLFASRLISRTDGDGQLVGGGPLGPYLRDIPPNPYNHLATIRIDGVLPGANIAGWRFSNAQRAIVGDHALAANGIIAVQVDEADTVGAASVSPGG